MFRQDFWNYALFVVFGLAVICFNGLDASEIELKNTGLEHAVSIDQYNIANEDTFTFRYQFSDGSIASGVGVLTDGSVFQLQKGHFRFNIRQKIYEFEYNIDADGHDHGHLKTVAVDGSTTDESYTTDGKRLHDGFGFSRFHQLYEGLNFYDWYMKMLFPANENHPLFLCKFHGHADTLKSRFECVTYENRTEDVIGHTLNKPDTEWLHDFIEPVSKTLSFENHHDETGGYHIKYIFSGGAAIHEIGEFDSNNTISYVNGSIQFRNFNINYIGNATAYNVSLDYSDVYGSRKHAQYQLHYVEREEHGIKTQVYSDDKGFDLIGIRQQIDVDEQPFVKARIEIGLPYEFGNGLRLIQNFVIGKTTSDAILEEVPPPLSPLSSLSPLSRLSPISPFSPNAYDSFVFKK